jgi:WNK lysine deficient protein kinase
VESLFSSKLSYIFLAKPYRSGESLSISNLKSQCQLGAIAAADNLFDDASSQSSSHSGTYSNVNYFSGNEYEPSTSPTRGDQHTITKSHKCTRFCPGEVHGAGQSLASNCCRQCKVLQGSHGASTSKVKGLMDNRRLTRNSSLVDVRSQLLHRSLVEEVNKRRLFKTVGAVENIGFQAPCEVSKKVSRPSAAGGSLGNTKTGKKQGHQRGRI